MLYMNRQASTFPRERPVPGISLLNCALIAPGQIPPEVEPGSQPGFDINSSAWAVQLSDHLVPYVGSESIDKEKFVWGLYGTNSHDQGLFMASAYASQESAKVLTVQGTFTLSQSGFQGRNIDREAMRKFGYLHADRLQAAFRDELKEKLLQVAARRYDGFDPSAYRKTSLSQLLKDLPKLVGDIFEMEKKVMLVVHEVRPLWDVTKTLHVCTIRRDAHRLRDVQVRYLPMIQVNH